MRAHLALLLPLSGLLFLSGCSLLIGNVKPVTEKSEQYGVIDLSKERPDVWEKLPPNEGGAATATEVSDVAYQSKKSAAIISLNSSCRAHMEEKDKDLNRLTNLLLLGITPSSRTEKSLTVQNTPALETTIDGRLNNSEIKLRTIVLRRETCVYDLMYMAPPSRFPENEADFSNFVASLRLK